MVKHGFHRVLLALTYILLILFIAGCDGRDAQFRKQIVGIWCAEEKDPIFFTADGSFGVTNMGYHSSISYGTWSVKHAVLNLSLTNKTSDIPLDTRTNFIPNWTIITLNQTNLHCADNTRMHGMLRYRLIE